MGASGGGEHFAATPADGGRLALHECPAVVADPVEPARGIPAELGLGSLNHAHVGHITLHRLVTHSSIVRLLGRREGVDARRAL